MFQQAPSRLQARKHTGSGHAVNVSGLCRSAEWLNATLERGGATHPEADAAHPAESGAPVSLKSGPAPF